MAWAFVVVLSIQYLFLHDLGRASPGGVIIVEQPNADPRVNPRSFMSGLIVVDFPIANRLRRLPVAPLHDVEPNLAQICKSKSFDYVSAVIAVNLTECSVAFA